jgi:hypothetical protein
MNTLRPHNTSTGHANPTREHPRPESLSQRRTLTAAGALGIVGGGLCPAPLLAEHRFGLGAPGRGTGYAADQLLFGAAMTCYIVALLGLRRAGPAGPSRTARWAITGWATGWLPVLLGLLTALTVPNSFPGQVLPVLGGLLTAILGVLTGFLIARAGTWRGWRRWTPLAAAM